MKLSQCTFVAELIVPVDIQQLCAHMAQRLKQVDRVCVLQVGSSCCCKLYTLHSPGLWQSCETNNATLVLRNQTATSPPFHMISSSPIDDVIIQNGGEVVVWLRETNATLPTSSSPSPSPSSVVSPSDALYLHEYFSLFLVVITKWSGSVNCRRQYMSSNSKTTRHMWSDQCKG